MTADPCSVDHEFARNAFIMEISPICYMQLAEIKYLRDDAEFEYSFFNFPAVEDGKGDPGQLTGAPEGMMISATAEPAVQEAAIKFMKFVISKEGGYNLIAKTGEISCVKGAWDETNCDAKQLEAHIAAAHGVKATVITNVGPVIGSHSGPGTLALFFLGKNR